MNLKKDALASFLFLLTVIVSTYIVTISGWCVDNTITVVIICVSIISKNKATTVSWIP